MRKNLNTLLLLHIKVTTTNIVMSKSQNNSSITTTKIVLDMKYCSAITKKGPQCSRIPNIGGGIYCRFHATRITQDTELQIKKELDKINPDIANSIVLHTKHKITDKVKKLLKINEKMPEQRTKEWYEYRSKIVTASPAGAYLFITDYEFQLSEKNVICLSTTGRKLKERDIGNRRCHCYSNWKDQVQRKCFDKPWRSNKYMRHGVKYEAVICDIYEHNTGSKVLEFGIMPHKTLDWLGASPDGITTSGKMIEIKAPTRKELTKEIILQYWIQMQLQMEVCDLDECDFVEARIVEYPSKEEYLKDKFYDEEGSFKYYLTKDELPKGQVITMKNNWNQSDEDKVQREYVYPPALTFKNQAEEDEWIKDWIRNKLNSGYDWLFNEDVTKHEIRYYKVVQWEIETVKRDRKWFELRKDELKASWDTILHYRKHGVPDEFHIVPPTKSSDYWFADSDDEDETPAAPKSRAIPMLDLSVPDRKTKNESKYEVDVFN